MLFIIGVGVMGFAQGLATGSLILYFTARRALRNLFKQWYGFDI